MNQLPGNAKPVSHKVVILGDSQVGKTSIIARQMLGCQPETQTPTIGCHCSEIRVLVDEEPITLQVWDTAGQEMYRSLVPVYLRGAEAALLVYDITDRESFCSLGHWKDILADVVPESTPLFVIGNKIDLEEDEAVEDSQAQQFAQRQNSKLYKVSAVTGQGLGLLFEDIARGILQNAESTKETSNQGLEANDGSGRCC